LLRAALIHFVEVVGLRLQSTLQDRRLHLLAKEEFTLLMKNQNWITVLALRSSIVLSIVLLFTEVSYATSMGKPFSYLIAASPSPGASLTTSVSPTPTQTSLKSLTDDAINENEKFNFELLHDAAKRNYDRYMNVVWGSFSFLLIAIGWIITSEKARIFLHEKKVVRNVALRAICIRFFWTCGETEGVANSFLGKMHPEALLDKDLTTNQVCL
jgi:hypothetical protein